MERKPTRFQKLPGLLEAGGVFEWGDSTHGLTGLSGLLGAWVYLNGEGAHQVSQGNQGCLGCQGY